MSGPIEVAVRQICEAFVGPEPKNADIKAVKWDDPYRFVSGVLREVRRQAASEAIAGALELYRPDAEFWAEQITEGVYDAPSIETREEFKEALTRHFFALKEAGRRQALEEAAQICVNEGERINPPDAPA